MHAYERAEMPRETAVSRAYYLREQARSTPGGSHKAANARKDAFLVAATAFLSCAEQASKEKLAYFKIAGSCFVEAEDDVAAAKAFLRAQEYKSAAKHFRNAGMFDEAVDVIQNHGEQVPSDVSESIVNVARIHYFEKQQLEFVVLLR
jgi:hypothetical protein